MDLQEYLDNGRPLISIWLKSLDKSIKGRVIARINRLRLGNFGDSKSVGDGVHELRLDFGPGYRVYFGRQGVTVVILLCAGDKDSQTQDITRAKRLWGKYCQEATHDYQTL